MKFLFLSILLLSNTILPAQHIGNLDPSFGIRGTTIDSSVKNITDAAMKVAKDGKILIGTAGPYNGFSFTFKIDALLPDGSPDISFGVSGSAYVLFPGMIKPQDNASITSIALLPDGRILAAGAVYATANPNNIAFARFKPDGTIDSSFGTNGTATASFGYPDQAAGSMKIQADGKIVIGACVLVNPEQFTYKLSTSRFMPDGAKDLSYGNDGIVVSNATGCANSIAVQKDGKIVAAGYGGVARSDLSHFHIERYNTDGSYDKSFGISGIVDTKIGIAGSVINDVAIQEDGKLVVTGNAPLFTVARYNTDGSLDNSFGTEGVITNTFSQLSVGKKVFITGEEKDKIIVVGANYGSFVLVGYNSNGTLDPEFGTNGIQTTIFEGTQASVATAELQSDGKIVLLGTTQMSQYPFTFYRTLARYYGYPQKVSLLVRIKRWLQNHTLSWKGLPAEDNIAYYTVEQSSNSSKGFTPVAKVSSVSNLKDYSITNSHLLQGANYYRIKAVSTDGVVRYSEVVSADNMTNTASVYPNPAKNYVTVQGLPTGETANISIKDGSGNVLARGVSTGSAQYRSPLGSNMQPGTYYVNVTTGSKTETLKFVKE